MTPEEFIITVERVQWESERLLRRKQRLLSPRLEDYALIPGLYERYTKLNIQREMSRRVFVLVIMLLYSPKSLIGRKLNLGLRDELAKLFRCERSLISHLMRNIVFWYKNDKSFRSLADYALEELGYSDF